MPKPLELLDALVTIAQAVLRNDAQVRVTDTMLDELDGLVRTERGRLQECERLIDDECVMLVTALKRVVWAREEGNADRAQRWSMIVRALLAWLATDLALAGGRVVPPEDAEKLWEGVR